MHRTHQRYKKIWAHPLPNGHFLWQPKGGTTTSKIFKKTKNKKPNVKFNILHEDYPQNNGSIAYIEKIL
jgi:hypothetical protein